MENEEIAAMCSDGMHKKTDFQLSSLEIFYMEEKYPSQKAMEEYAACLNLSYKQVHQWFAGRRKKEKMATEGLLDSYCKFIPRGCRVGRVPTSAIRGTGGKQKMEIYKRKIAEDQIYTNSVVEKLKRCKTLKPISHHGYRTKSTGPVENFEHVRKLFGLQDMLTAECILTKVFHKDGPLFGVEFDPVPAGAFGFHSDSEGYHLGCEGSPRNSERRKLHVSLSPTCMDSQARKRKSGPAKKYGMGKGLMTVWRATNLNPTEFRTNFISVEKEASNMFFSKNHQMVGRKASKSQHRRLPVKQRKVLQKVPERRKPLGRKTKGGSFKDKSQTTEHRGDCDLALGALRSDEPLNPLMKELIDDEELELREQQAGPNPLTCSHLSTNGSNGCSLCKELLARFPPLSVKMKQPLNVRPWDSSPVMVKKLFKIFSFLYTHSVPLHMCPFTLDEFAFAFHEKESFLLGKIHMALLKVLLSDVEREFEIGYLPCAPKDNRYVRFLHFVRCQEFDVKFWNKCLNSLTWPEILRQVLVAAGYGVRQNSFKRPCFGKEANAMVKFGLRHGTLKGELFNILYEQGSKGMKVSDLAKAPQVVGLHLPDAPPYVIEHLIHSTLSGDITVFEKISSCAYRLRLNPQFYKAIGIAPSGTEESGSVDDDSDSSSDSETCDSQFISESIDLKMIQNKGQQSQKSNGLTEYTEIDESYPGEPWALGLMEGEYSDLSIEEKLNVLVALVDLTAAGSSIRMEDPMNAITETRPDVCHHASGAKIKRSILINQVLAKTSWDHFGHHLNMRQSRASKVNDREAPHKPDFIVHPMQSVYLGSDRRYNSYWLFLGPCNERDPGHRRIYFESSEDGHWEVIDTLEALCTLISVLDSRGTREAHLFTSLQKREASLCRAMAVHVATVNETRQPVASDKTDIEFNGGDGNSPISDVDNGLIASDTACDPQAPSSAIVFDLGKCVEKQRLDHLRTFDTWVWRHFYSTLNAVKFGRRSYLESLARCESCHDLYWRDEKHCKTCHTTFELDFDMEERYTIHSATCNENEDSDQFLMRKVLPSKLQSLKAAMHAVEANMPDEALVNTWRKSSHKLWVKRLRRTSSLQEFLQVLSDFVNAISEEWLCKCSIAMGPNTAFDEIVIFFPTLPQTSASVALWLVKLDAVIALHLEGVQSGKAKKNTTSNH